MFTYFGSFNCVHTVYVSLSVCIRQCIETMGNALVEKCRFEQDLNVRKILSMHSQQENFFAQLYLL